jgi:dTDP-4-dehydrorhamnose reductase
VRVVISGREGQLVRSLIERASGDAQVVALGRPELDLAGSADRIVDAIQAAQPDLVISAAAYTQVDRAESERELAFAVNAEGPRAMAVAARKCGVPLIHLSTDYVFDGAKASPYLEEDPAGPTSVYGASKLAGEQAVLAEHSDTAVIRTAWVYSPFGTNFVKTMLRLASDRDEVSVVADQRGNPTSALDIADGLLAVAKTLGSSEDSALRGIFHMTSPREATWAEFAEAIFQVSARAGGPTATIKHIRTSEYPTAAARPANSRLDSTKLARVYGVRLPDWRGSMATVVTRVLTQLS